MKNKWFCIGVSGATIDGRTISAEDLQQMAAGYSPEKYGARINIEHLRSFWPGSELGGYGDVLELKAETRDNVTRLYARIDPTEKMLSLLKKREKVYTSMEIMKNFAGSGQAYLVGLALTDSPASTGTEMLKFSLQQQPEALISQPTEMKESTMSQPEKKTGLFAALMASLFAANSQPESDKPEDKPEPTTEERLSAAEEELTAAYTVIEKIGEAYTAQEQRLTALEAKLEALEATPVNQRDAHTGAAGTQSQF